VSAGVRIEVINCPSRLTELEPVWRELHAAAGPRAPVFLHPGWAIPSWSIFGDGYELYCLALFQGRDLAAIAPFMLRGEGGVKILRFIGWPLNDYEAFLMKPGLEQSIGDIIFRHLRRRPLRWHLLECRIFEDPVQALGVHREYLRGIGTLKLDSEPSALLRLPGHWDTYCGGLSGQSLRSFHYAERRLLLRHGAEFRVLTEPEAISIHMPTFRRLRVAAWHACGLYDRLPEIEKTGRFWEFLEAATQALATAGLMRFAVLELSGRIIAMGIYPAGGAAIMKYIQAWDYEYKQLSPGQVLDWLMIRHAISEGFEEFDFGRGDEHYKSRFGCALQPLTNISLAPGIDVRGTAKTY
jgi:CelD/BcsL family acetyltransferase involved in cellulose biosynthesis